MGDDGFGQNIRGVFAVDGIDISAVHMIENTPTGIAMIQVSDCGENSICIAAAANDALTAEVVNQHCAQIAAANYLLMQLETPLAGIEYAASIAKANGTQVILNPAPARALPDALLAMVDIITPNETEAEVLTGVAVTDADSAAKAAQALHDKGIAIVMITLGSKGVYISQQGTGKIISGFKVTATDTTAAGDTFNGAFVTGLLEGKAIEDAVVFAHGAAAISVTRFGAQTSIPSRDEVEQFITAQ